MRCCLQYKNAHLLVKTVLEIPQATMRKLLRALRWPTVMAALIFTAITFCNIAVLSAGNINEEPSKCDAIVVLGTLVHEDGSLSIMLQDRVDKGIELYNQGIANTILMSGDGEFEDYNEVEAMKQYAIEQGIPADAIVLDPYGLSTYETAYRAYHVYKYQSVVMVTQRFHINRAVFLGRAFNMETYGVACNEHNYKVSHETSVIRESLARVKAIGDAIFKPPAKYMT